MASRIGPDEVTIRSMSSAANEIARRSGVEPTVSMRTEGGLERRGERRRQLQQRVVQERIEEVS